MIMIAIPSYVVWRVDQHKVHLSSQILFDAKFVLLHEMFELHVVNGAKGSYGLD